MRELIKILIALSNFRSKAPPFTSSLEHCKMGVRCTHIFHKAPCIVHLPCIRYFTNRLGGTYGAYSTWCFCCREIHSFNNKRDTFVNAFLWACKPKTLTQIVFMLMLSSDFNFFFFQDTLQQAPHTKCHRLSQMEHLLPIPQPRHHTLQLCIPSAVPTHSRTCTHR